MYSGRPYFTGQTKWLFAAAAFALTILATGLSAAALPCSSGTVADYQIAGFQCTIDGYTLEDFSFNDSATGGATLLAPSDIGVNPFVDVGGGVAVTFTGDFSATEGQTAQYLIQYELDPLLPRIIGATVTTGPNDPVTLIGQFCGNGTLGAYVPGQSTSCSGTDTTGIFPSMLTIVGNNQSASLNFPTLVTDLDTRLILNLDGPASIRSFGTAANLTSTPEPSTSLWLATGLLGFVGWRKKLARKS
jgi:hypothetical protein